MEKGLSFTGGNILYSKLKCAVCRKCLSVGPVSVRRGLLEQYGCGRCYPRAKQCPLYAVIAEHLTFPCVFEPCEEQLKWGTVKMHEQFCPYRDFSCPFSRCFVRCQPIDFKSHFKDVHVLHNKTFHSGIIRPSESPGTNLHCILYTGIIFLVFIKCSYPLKFEVLCIPSTENRSNLECEVVINVNPFSNVTKIFKLDCDDIGDIGEYIDTRHCLNCVDLSCDKPGHRNGGGTFLTNECEFLHDYVSYDIKIYSKKESNASRSSGIECPICFNDLGEKIYLCSTGHSFCSDCYVNIEQCPICGFRTTDNTIRNFALEEILRKRRNKN
ncbi:unnamed protein product [Callosobruchus maculatus]|uniref:RING-type domain-containing protein n=1 Tax=Callosobruchus maculatus TaxID=64391 RepID=A0A653D4N5_CALMS|nr:unnamed protein product [Callosobruchus maculatus]